MGNSQEKSPNTFTFTSTSDFKPFEKVKAATPEGSPGVDLCFMLDCTGSMTAYIEMSKNKIIEIIQKTNESYPKSEIRIAIIAYRDIGDKGQQDVFPFSYNANKAKKFLSKQSASGGGDTPEDVNGAFQNLLKLDWKSPVRLVVHIADAPCHGKEYHDCGDTYPGGYEGDKKWDDIWKEFVELRLNYLFLKIMNTTDKMFVKFKELAEKHGSVELELSFEQQAATYSTALVNSGEMDVVLAKEDDHFASNIRHQIKLEVCKEMKRNKY